MHAETNGVTFRASFNNASTQYSAVEYYRWIAARDVSKPSRAPSRLFVLVFNNKTKKNAKRARTPSLAQQKQPKQPNATTKVVPMANLPYNSENPRPPATPSLALQTARTIHNVL